MNYVILATLREGIEAHRPCTDTENLTVDEAMRVETRPVQSERDPLLSLEEMWKLQGRKAGYIKSKLLRKEAA